MACDTTAPIICKILNENGLPELQCFILRGHSIQGIQRHIAKVLRSNKPMDSLVLHLGPDQGPVVQSIVEHHKFLKLLDLGTSELSMLALQEIMTSLPALRSLSAYTNIEVGANGESTQRHWACKEIISLQLRLHTRRTESTMASDKWADSIQKQGLDHIFSETARMKGLQELQIGYSRELYTMESGYLTQLADLKQLWMFDLVLTPDTKFGKIEALWMADNWPRLIQVYSRGASEVFCRTLLERRPLMKIE